MINPVKELFAKLFPHNESCVINQIPKTQYTGKYKPVKLVWTSWTGIKPSETMQTPWAIISSSARTAQLSWYKPDEPVWTPEPMQTSWANTRPVEQVINQIDRF